MSAADRRHFGDAANVERLESVLGAPLADIAEVVCSDPDVRKAVRGSLAEHLLAALLSALPGVAAVEHPTGRHQPDRVVQFHDGSSVRLECKNADAAPLADGTLRLDLRRATTDADQRLYRPDAFDAVAACVERRSGGWRWVFKATAALDTRMLDLPQGGLELRLEPNQRLDATWRDTLADALADVGHRSAAADPAGPTRVSPTPSTQLRLEL